jgi:ribosome biogenesis GTPase
LPPLAHTESKFPFLTSIGWNDDIATKFSDDLEPGLIPGRVSRVDRISSIILTEDGPVRAEPSADMLETTPSEELPAIGDWVGMLRRPRHDTDSIEVVLPRVSTLARVRGSADSRRTATRIQVIAVNVDFVFATHAAVRPSTARMAREVSQIEQSGAVPILLLTKADLVDDPAAVVEQVGKAMPGLRIHLTSGLNGDGINELRQYLTGNRTVVFIGASGVGKSTISNQLLGEEALTTEEVRAHDGRGRHTTTARHLMPIPGGGVLIDTPGMRTFTLQAADDGLERTFTDIDALSQMCSFRDCRHEREPGCAVQAAIASGDLNTERFDSYRKLGNELRHMKAKADKAAYADERRRGRDQSIRYKRNVKPKKR